MVETEGAEAAGQVMATAVAATAGTALALGGSAIAGALFMTLQKVFVLSNLRLLELRAPQTKTMSMPMTWTTLEMKPPWRSKEDWESAGETTSLNLTFCQELQWENNKKNEMEMEVSSATLFLGFRR